MTDRFARYTPELDSPGENLVAITPSANELAKATRALYIGGGGDVVVTSVGGETVTFSDVLGGTILPIRVTHVLAATTATNIIGIS